jgi:hypothetical protein
MVSKQGRHRLPARTLKERRPRLGEAGPSQGKRRSGGIIGFGCQTRETEKGSNNNAAQAEYDRSAALSYSLKSLKSSSRRFVLQDRLRFKVFVAAAGRGLDRRKQAIGTF